MAATKRLIEKLAAQGRAVEADTDNSPATDATSASVETEGTAITTVELSPAVTAALESIAQIETALAVLSPASAAATALQAALADAQGTLSLAQADAALEAEKMAEIASAQTAGAALPAHLLDAMLAAIEAKYSPAPAVVEAAPAPEAVNGMFGRKAPSPATQALNAAAVQALASDSTVGLRCAATVAAFDKDWASELVGVYRYANTRFPSVVAFAGDGVASEADYKQFVPALRAYMLQIGIPAGTKGQSYASTIWVLAQGAHAPNGPKGSDSLPLKFKAPHAAVAQFADGRFRLARAGTANVRWVATDAAAGSAYRGGSAATQAAPAQASPASAQAAPAAARIPTAPATVALPNGALAQTARCQNCTARNVVGEPACAACGSEDWNAAA